MIFRSGPILISGWNPKGDMKKSTKIIGRKLNGTDLIKIMMIAPCGMNCTLCSGYLGEKRLYKGCRSGDADMP